MLSEILMAGNSEDGHSELDCSGCKVAVSEIWICKVDMWCCDVVMA
jgi:hypothetical protein